DRSPSSSATVDVSSRTPERFSGGSPSSRPHAVGRRKPRGPATSRDGASVASTTRAGAGGREARQIRALSGADRVGPTVLLLELRRVGNVSHGWPRSAPRRRSSGWGGARDLERPAVPRHRGPRKLLPDLRNETSIESSSERKVLGAAAG